MWAAFGLGLVATICSIVSLSTAWTMQTINVQALDVKETIHYKVFDGLQVVISNEGGLKSIKAFTILACLFAGFGTLSALAHVKSPSGAKSGSIANFVLSTLCSLTAFLVYVGMVSGDGPGLSTLFIILSKTASVYLYSVGFGFQVATAVFAFAASIAACCTATEDEPHGDYGAPPPADGISKA